jgi:ribosomal-protein-alanine N-acetyltransferase
MSPAAPAPIDRLARVPVFPELSTPRLRLRQLTRADAPWYRAHFSDPAIVHGTGFPALADLAAAEAELTTYVLDLFDARTGLRWGLVPVGGEELIGSAGLFRWQDAPEPAAEVGYDLVPEWWGRGLATEALGAICAYAFGTLGLHRLDAFVLDGNDRSRRTLERAGFRHVGLLSAHGEDEHGLPRDEHHYELRVPAEG